MQIPYETLCQDIMRDLRGNRSLTDMDRRYRFSKGQYSRWESGSIEVKWDDFVRVAKKENKPLKKALADSTRYEGNPFHFAAIIKACLGRATHTEIARNLGVTRYSVMRWLAGESCPALWQMLKVIELGTSLLSTFLQTLGEGHEYPSFAPYRANLNEGLHILQDWPWVSGLLCALELTEYRRLPKHDDHWIAAKARIPVGEAKQALRTLEARQIIRMENQHYVPTSAVLNPSILRQKARHLLSYWMERNLASVRVNYPSPNRRSLSSYTIFSVDKKTAAAIKEKYIAFTRDMVNLIHSGERHSEEIYSFTLSMVNFEDLVDEK